jgi:hypothetical protein
MTKERKQNLCLIWLLISVAIFLIILGCASLKHEQEYKDMIVYILLGCELSCFAAMFCLYRTNKIKENE